MGKYKPVSCPVKGIDISSGKGKQNLNKDYQQYIPKPKSVNQPKENTWK